MRTYSLLSSLLFISLAQAAAAQTTEASDGEGPPSSVPPAPIQPSAPEPATTAASIPTTATAETSIDPAYLTNDAGIIEDANAGWAFLTPTALTAPKGSFSFNATELFIWSFSYGITDKIELTGGGLVPITDEFLFGFLNLKTQVLRANRWRISLNGTAFFSRFDDDFDDETVVVGHIGGVATFCFDDGCHSNLSTHLAFGVGENDEGIYPFTASLSAQIRASDHIKFLLEANTAGIAGNEINDFGEGVLFNYGIRFTSKNITADVGLMKPLCEGCDEVFPLGFPYMSIKYRTM